MTRPRNDFQRIGIFIPEAMDWRIDRACARDNLDRGDLLRAALDQYLTRSEQGVHDNGPA
ncbi:ribbon-helix-helix protein, CopG family [Mesorhizobium sp. M0184]|uniref:ribbon-helix-helix protein, CopG family n=1 Tax=unclassified Mesorhizobium TaxID=325217 RepID=UPI0033363B5A